MLTKPPYRCDIFLKRAMSLTDGINTYAKIGHSNRYILRSNTAFYDERFGLKIKLTIRT